MHSTVLLDRDRLLSDTQLASRMGYAIAKHYFLNRADVVATPSVWGAGLAQWVGYFLDPRRPVIYPTRGLELPEASREQINGKRVLVIDNLVLSGKTMQEFVQAVARRRHADRRRRAGRFQRHRLPDSGLRPVERLAWHLRPGHLPGLRRGNAGDRSRLLKAPLGPALCETVHDLAVGRILALAP